MIFNSIIFSKCQRDFCMCHVHFIGCDVLNPWFMLSDFPSVWKSFHIPPCSFFPPLSSPLFLKTQVLDFRTPWKIQEQTIREEGVGLLHPWVEHCGVAMKAPPRIFLDPTTNKKGWMCKLLRDAGGLFCLLHLQKWCFVLDMCFIRQSLCCVVFTLGLCLKRRAEEKHHQWFLVMRSNNKWLLLKTQATSKQIKCLCLIRFEFFLLQSHGWLILGVEKYTVYRTYWIGKIS